MPLIRFFFSFFLFFFFSFFFLFLGGSLSFVSFVLLFLSFFCFILFFCFFVPLYYMFTVELGPLFDFATAGGVHAPARHGGDSQAIPNQCAALGPSLAQDGVRSDPRTACTREPQT
jgi:hypothetical protein